MDETRHLKQRDELEVLQSIFEEDIVEHKLFNCWKQPCALEVRIRLKPSGEEAYASVELDVACPSSYPDDPPNLNLLNPVGFSQQKREELEERLRRKARQLAGTVMIYDLCQMVIEFLSTHNQRPVGSMHEAMLQACALKAEREQQFRAETATRELAEIAEENERRRVDAQTKWDEAARIRESTMLAEMMKLGELSVDYEAVDPIGADGVQSHLYKLVNFKNPRPSLTNTYSTAADWCALERSGTKVLVTEWTFEHTLGRGLKGKELGAAELAKFVNHLDNAIRGVVGTLTSLKRTLDQQQRLLVPCVAVKAKKMATLPTNLNCRVLVAQTVDLDNEKCMAVAETHTHVKNNFSRLGPLMATQLLDALRCLHSNGLSHGHLQLSSIWFDPVKCAFRLSDHHIFRLLLDLQRELRLLTSDEPLADGVVTRQAPQQRDLFCLGSILDSLLPVSDAEASLLPEGGGKRDSGGGGEDEIVAEARSLITCLQQAKCVDDVVEHMFLRRRLHRWPGDFSSETSTFTNELEAGVDSRLMKEFQVVQWLGRGGFGDVYLARNKLDDNEYAIKRIPLNRRNERLNQKILREAKLFSRLNHEHVVRYYAAWIEEFTCKPAKLEAGQTSTSRSFSAFGQQPRPDQSIKIKKEAELSAAAASSSSDEEEGVRPRGKFWRRPDIVAVDTTSTAPSGVAHERKSSTHTLFSPRRGFHPHHSKSITAPSHSEFDVVFDDDDDEEDQVPGNGEGRKVQPKLQPGNHNNISNNEDDGEARAPQAGTSPFRQILYIQMEYCSNSTLRTLIDSGRLYPDPRTIWRLFREILSGVRYIHAQGLLHRDLKPMNILLDWSWSAKIGDFGLATRDLKPQQQLVASVVDENKKKGKARGSSTGQLTKDIGTTLYIAPEIQGRAAAGSVTQKLYSSKIDIYSLGVVLFEMVWRVPPTIAERLTTIQRLRSTHPAEFPDNFGQDTTSQHRLAAKNLVAWMMNPDPGERPTADVLMRSELIPMVEYGGEDDFHQKFFTQALKKPRSKFYKYMVDELMRQEISPAVDYCYDQAVCTRENELEASEQTRTVEYLRAELAQIFQLHAFVPMRCHALIPSNAHRQSQDASRALLASSQQPCRVMDGSGLPVELPRSLRHSFIRHCARNGTNRMKRYAFGTVYNQTETSGVHPTERMECCLDLVGAASDKEVHAADILLLVTSLTRRIPGLEGLKCTLVVSHSKLLRATFFHLGINDPKVQDQVLNVLYYISTLNKRLSHERKCEHLVEKCELSYQLAGSLLRLLDSTPSLEELSEQFRPMSRSKLAEVKENSKQALGEISRTIHMLKVMMAGGMATRDAGITISYDPALAYRPQMFHAGLLYLLRVELFQEGAAKSLVVLAGGAYESCIESERRPQDPLPATPICAFGVNIPMENLAQLHQQRRAEGMSSIALGPLITCTALVCAASSDFAKDKFELVNRLRAHNLSAEVVHDTVQSAYQVIEQCSFVFRFLLLVVEKDEVIVYACTESIPSYTANRTGNFQISHSRVSCEEAVRVIQQAVSVAAGAQHLNLIYSPPHQNHHQLGGAEQVATTSGNSNSASPYANLNINYVLAEERGQKPPQNTRRKIESQVRHSLNDSLLSRLRAKCRVEVFVTDLAPDLLRLLSSLLDRSMVPTELKRAVDSVYKQAGRQKGDVELLYYSIQSFFEANDTYTKTDTSPLLVLWTRASGSEGFYRVIT